MNWRKILAAEVENQKQNTTDRKQSEKKTMKINSIIKVNEEKVYRDNWEEIRSEIDENEKITKRIKEMYLIYSKQLKRSYGN